MKYSLFAFSLLFTVLSCRQNADKKDNGLQEIRLDAKTANADIVRMPISADKPLDTVNIAKISFDNAQYNFGKITEGGVVKHTFTFKNTGKTPLLISDVRTTCGCTVPTWNKNPIAAGASDKIDVSFNTADKKNEQVKKITVLANTFPAETQAVIMGVVTAKN
jgi:Protein of unknown function (DUF1573)